jgi:AAA15 family ATPase/GTPase
LPVLIEALRLGQVLLLDEIEGSFHPHIVSLIIRMFNDPAVNRQNAQLIFTTHDTSILDEKLFRRDQIWFVEKTEGQSELRSLDEYDKRLVKSNSPFRAWYDEGRFGGLPQIQYQEFVHTVKDVLEKLGNR